MKMKKYLACLMAATLMCGAFTACGGNEETSSKEEESKVESVESKEESAAESAEESKAPVEVTTAAAVEVEDAVTAESGQAYLAITDSQWWIQYWGSAEDAGYMLSYNAGVADITGDGQYTVSVTADTNGFRLDTTGAADDQYTPSGLGFAAVIIKDGETVCPNAIITIDSIVIDGTEIAMTAKNYTNTEEGAIRSNIYNSWVTTPSGDARCADGYLFNDFDSASPALDNAAEYSAMVVDPASFNAWTTVEVNFTVSGMDGAAAEGGEGAESAAEGAESAAEGGEAAAESAAE